jgi:hypothetical protein
MNKNQIAVDAEKVARLWRMAGELILKPATAEQAAAHEQDGRSLAPTKSGGARVSSCNMNRQPADAAPVCPLKRGRAVDADMVARLWRMACDLNLKPAQLARAACVHHQTAWLICESRGDYRLFDAGRAALGTGRTNGREAARTAIDITRRLIAEDSGEQPRLEMGTPQGGTFTTEDRTGDDLVITRYTVQPARVVFECGIGDLQLALASSVHTLAHADARTSLPRWVPQGIRLRIADAVARIAVTAARHAIKRLADDHGMLRLQRAVFAPTKRTAGAADRRAA